MCLSSKMSRGITANSENKAEFRPPDNLIFWNTTNIILYSASILLVGLCGRHSQFIRFVGIQFVDSVLYNIMGNEASIPHVVEVGQRRVRPKGLLGEGGFSHVFLVTDDTTGEELVLKRARIPVDHEENVRIARREMHVLEVLPPHPCVVTWLGQAENRVAAAAGGYGACIDFDILMPNCTGGTAAAELAGCVKRGEAMPEARVLRRWRDLCAGVAHLHAQSPPLIHRDLKLENLLLCHTASAGIPPPAASAVTAGNDPEGQWFLGKLCDFGSCEVGATPIRTEAEVAAAESWLDKTTTLAFRAPELTDPRSVGLLIPERNDRWLGPASDVWALGCALFQLCFGVTPFEDPATGVPQRIALLNGRFRLPPPSSPLQGHYSEGLLDLIRACLAVDPRRRPTVSELIRMGSALPSWPKDDPSTIQLAAALRPGRRKQSVDVGDKSSETTPSAAHFYSSRGLGSRSRAGSGVGISSTLASNMGEGATLRDRSVADFAPIAPHHYHSDPGHASAADKFGPLTSVRAAASHEPSVKVAVSSSAVDVGSAFGLSSRRLLPPTHSNSPTAAASSTGSGHHRHSATTAVTPALPAFRGAGRQPTASTDSAPQAHPRSMSEPQDYAPAVTQPATALPPAPAARSRPPSDVEQFMIDAFANNTPTTPAPVSISEGSDLPLDGAGQVDFGRAVTTAGRRTPISSSHHNNASVCGPTKKASVSTAEEAGSIWDSGLLENGSSNSRAQQDSGSVVVRSAPAASCSSSTGGAGSSFHHTYSGSDEDSVDSDLRSRGHTAGAQSSTSASAARAVVSKGRSVVSSAASATAGIARAAGGLLLGTLTAIGSGAASSGAVSAAGTSGGGGLIREALHTRVLQVLGVESNRHRWLIKATSLRPGPPKLKYVRRLLLDAWEHRDGSGDDGSGQCAVAVYLPRRPLLAQPVVGIKACVLLMKLWQQGPPGVIRTCRALLPILRQLAETSLTDSRVAIATTSGSLSPSSFRAYARGYASFIAEKLLLSSAEEEGGLYGADRVSHLAPDAAAAMGQAAALNDIIGAWARAGGIAGAQLRAGDPAAAVAAVGGLLERLQSAAALASSAFEVEGVQQSLARGYNAAHAGATAGNPNNLHLMSQGMQIKPGGGSSSGSGAGARSQQPADAVPPAVACVIGSLQPLLVEIASGYAACLFSLLLLRLTFPSYRLSSDLPAALGAIRSSVTSSYESFATLAAKQPLAALMDPVDSLPVIPPPPAVPLATVLCDDGAASSPVTLRSLLLSLAAVKATAEGGGGGHSSESANRGTHANSTHISGGSAPVSRSKSAGPIIPASELVADPGPIAPSGVEAGIRAITSTPGNDACAECSGRVGGSAWASVNLGIVLCLRCSGLHRSLGVHISQVRSLTLDTWKPAWVRQVLAIGNVRANRFWEAHQLQAQAGKPTASSSLEDIGRWCRDKYETRAFAAAGPAPHELLQGAQPLIAQTGATVSSAAATAAAFEPFGDVRTSPSGSTDDDESVLSFEDEDDEIQSPQRQEQHQQGDAAAFSFPVMAHTAAPAVAEFTLDSPPAVAAWEMAPSAPPADADEDWGATVSFSSQTAPTQTTAADLLQFSESQNTDLLRMR